MNETHRPDQQSTASSGTCSPADSNSKHDLPWVANRRANGTAVTSRRRFPSYSFERGEALEKLCVEFIQVGRLALQGRLRVPVPPPTSWPKEKHDLEWTRLPEHTQAAAEKALNALYCQRNIFPRMIGLYPFGFCPDDPQPFLNRFDYLQRYCRRKLDSLDDGAILGSGFFHPDGMRPWLGNRIMQFVTEPPYILGMIVPGVEPSFCPDKAELWLPGPGSDDHVVWPEMIKAGRRYQR